MGEWLESLVPWGTEAIVYVQSLSPEWLDSVWAFFTYLGYEQFYLVAFPLVYWCIHKQVGIGLAYVSMLSTWFNAVVKHTFQIPRPDDPRIRVPLPEESPSFASNHAQNAIVNWGYVAYRFRQRVFTLLAGVAIVGISLSRIVLGVHYPQDVIGGLILGAVVLGVYASVAPAVGRWVAAQATAVQLVLAVGVPLALIFVHPRDAAGYYPAEGAITAMSALAGFGLGLLMERAWVRFQVGGAWWRRGVRFLVGMVVIGIFYAGPGQLLPDEMAYAWEALARFVRYALVGWAAAFLCPWLFVRLGLAESEGPAP